MAVSSEQNVATQWQAHQNHTIRPNDRLGACKTGLSPPVFLY